MYLKIELIAKNNELIIEDLIHEINSYHSKLEELNEYQQAIIEKTKEISKVEKELIEVKNNPKKIQYKEAISNYSNFQKSLDSKFSSIRKALRKYENHLVQS